LAQRHHSLQMTELADVRELLEGFEEQNNVRLVISFNLVKEGRSPDIEVVAQAFLNVRANGEVPPSVLVKLRCSTLNLLHWNAVLIHAMYALDFQLALNEWDAVEQKG